MGSDDQSHTAQGEGVIPTISEASSLALTGNVGVVELSPGEELLYIRFYGILLDSPIPESQIVPPSPDIDLERVPSPLSEERPTGGEDLLDQVSISDSPIAYSLEV